MHLGSVVGGYKLLELVGEGGMGTVFRGVDVMLEREVALKLLRPELTHQPDLVKRFQKEAITLARLNHQHIVTLHHMFRDGEKYFMVLEFVRGETLDRLIKRYGPIPWQTAVPLICQALHGLEHAHILKVIHRDIKPSNLILTQTGIVKLMDFGVARMLETNGLTQSGVLVGTLRYMSPEQIRGQDIDFRADIYAIGVVLYEMLTGHVPFNRNTNYEMIRAMVEETPESPRKFVSQLPRGLEVVVLRALAKSPQDRYQSAAEFRSDLEAFLNDSTADPSIEEAAAGLSGKGPWFGGTPLDDGEPLKEEKTRLLVGEPAGAVSAAAAYLRQRIKGIAVLASLPLIAFLAIGDRHEKSMPAAPVAVESEPSGPSIAAETLQPRGLERSPDLLPVAAPRETPNKTVEPSPVELKDRPPQHPVQAQAPEPPPVPAETSPEIPVEKAVPVVDQPARPAASNVAANDKRTSLSKKPESLPVKAVKKAVKKKSTARRRPPSKRVDGGWQIISE